MNREIKFRGRDTLGDWHKEMLSADGRHIIKTHRSADGTVRECYQEVEAGTIGQFTGLRDCNGGEIYEDDIIRRRAEPENTAVVTYDNGGFRGCGHYRINGQIGWMIRQGYLIEVVGNIHDNPDLLNIDAGTEEIKIIIPAPEVKYDREEAIRGLRNE